MDAQASALPPAAASGFRAQLGLAGVARRTLGIAMLMATVFLWTASNFLASFIFSDNTYSKPFFMVYLNTSVFAVSLLPMGLHHLRTHGVPSTCRALRVLAAELAEDVRDAAAQLRRRAPRAARGRGLLLSSPADDSVTNKLLEDTDNVDDDDDDGDVDVDGRRVRRRHRSASGAALLRGFGSGSDDSDDETTTAAAATTTTTAAPRGLSADRDAAVAAARLLRSGSGSGSAGGSGSGSGSGRSAAAVVDLEAGGVEAEPAAVAEADAPPAAGETRLGLRATFWLSLEFCMLWFAANYLAVACLEYTSVASATIFTSLSSVFTLLLCALAGIEAFSLRKLVGVLASLAGVALISSVDLSGRSDEHRGQFPHKTPAEIALGDAMALLSAVVYGLYVTVMKQRVGHEDRVSMPLFFGLVGLFNVVLLWPGFVLLHVTGIERFEPPPTNQVWTIILLNSLSSFFSDMSWAYAMLLTTPLVVTVGLSLTIPLSLIGEMIQYSKYSSGLYWAGAGIVVLSFLFVNHESHEADDAEAKP